MLSNFMRENFHFLSLFFLVFLTFAITPLKAAELTGTPKITVYKSPTCGCCNKWIKHLEQNGFNVEAHDRDDMAAIKQKIGVQPEYQSCHTAVIDGYYIEGHVPATDIKRLLANKPKARGLTVPGMPMGSPGMEGHRQDPYSVLIIDHKGKQKTYSKY